MKAPAPTNKLSFLEYAKRRDEVLMTADPLKLARFIFEVKGCLFANMALTELAMHRAITATPSLPIAHRIVSKRWLLDRGYRSWDNDKLDLQQWENANTKPSPSDCPSKSGAT